MLCCSILLSLFCNSADVFFSPVLMCLTPCQNSPILIVIEELAPLLHEKWNNINYTDIKQ